MNRRVSIVVASISILISAIYLITLICISSRKDEFILAYIYVGYFYTFSVLLFIIPSTIIWAIIILSKIRDIKNNRNNQLSVKLFTLSLLFNLTVFISLRYGPGTVKITVSNFSDYQIKNIKINDRKGVSSETAQLEVNDEKEFKCDCFAIRRPNDYGIRLAFKINKKEFDGFIVHPFSPTHDKEIEIRILNDSTFYISYTSQNQLYWTRLDRWGSPLLRWEEIKE